MNSHFVPARFAVLLALFGAARAAAAELPQRPAAEPVNLARGAAVKAGSSMESPPRWSKEYLTAGVRVVGGYCSRPTMSLARIHVTTELGGFTGSWRNVGDGTAYGGNFAYSVKRGDTFEYPFEGDTITWIGGMYPGQGEAEVFLDGKLQATVSTKTFRFIAQQVLFHKDRFGTGKHTLKIRARCEGAVDVNALEIAVGTPPTTSPNVGLGAVDEWVEIDLGADKSFSHVRLCPVWLHSTDGSGAPSFPVDYTLSVRPDGGAYAVVKTVRGQVNPGVAPVTLPVGPQRARFVKIAVSRVSGRAQGDAQDLLRLAEVEVLGPVPAAPAAPAAPAKLPKPHWRLQTDDTAITVAVIDNRPVMAAFEPARGGWNWIKSPVAATAFPASVSLYRLPNMKDALFSGAVAWKFKGAEVDNKEGTRLTLRFGCDVPELELRPTWWAAPGRGPIEYTMNVWNKTGKFAAFSLEATELCFRYDIAPVLWRFHKDARSTDEVSLYFDPTREGAYQEVLTGDWIPLGVFDAGDHGLYVAGQWQQGALQFSASAVGDLKVRVPPILDHTDFPHEFASLYLGAYRGDVDQGLNGLKRWFFQHKAPASLRNNPSEPWSIYGGMWSYGAGWCSREEIFVKAMKEKLSSVGVEEVEIDNGWWGNDNTRALNWQYDPQLWPHGMETAGKTAHEAGFKLAVYFLLGGSPDYPACGRRMHDTMTRYGVDTYRSDFGAPHDPPGRAMLDWLIANHPGFHFECCDCGGNWKDYATCCRATTIFGIDVYDPLSLRKMFHTSSYAIPPAQLMLPLEMTFALKKESMVYSLRSSMLGQLYYGLAGTGIGHYVMPSDFPPVIEPMTQTTTLYKNKLRPLIREGDLYHPFLRPDGTDWDGIQYQHPTSGHGALLVFKPVNQFDVRRVVLRGLDRGKTYNLTFQDRPQQNTRKTGQELMDDGIDVTLRGQNVSEIIWIDGAE